MIDVRDFGAKFNGRRDDTEALLDALAEAERAFAGGSDVGGGEGDVLMLPKGTANLSAPLPNVRSRLKGCGTHHTVLRFRGLAPDEDAIVFGDGARALFDAGLEDLQIFIEGERAGNSCAVATRDLQHTGGFRRVKIFSQGSIGLKIAGGTGGAAYIPVHDVEIFSKPNLAGNPGMVIAYDGSSIIDLQRTVIQCPTEPHVANAPALLHTNGIVRAAVFHVENYDFGIQLQRLGAGRPLLEATAFTGNRNVHSVVVIGAEIARESVLARLGEPCGAHAALWNVATGETLARVFEYRY